MKLQLHCYLWKLNRALHDIEKKERRGILNVTKEGINIYLQDHPHCSFRDLSKYFGKPKEVASYYLPDGAVLKKNFLATKPILRFAAYTFCCVVLLFAVFFLGLFLLQNFMPEIPVYIKK